MMSSGRRAQNNQKDLHNWFKNFSAGGEEGESFLWDRSIFVGYMCWGLRGPNCMYASKNYTILSLFEDPHSGNNWYSEPHLSSIIEFESRKIIVNGAFRHKKCLRFSVSGVPFTNFTCTMCTIIPQEKDFRCRVVREDNSIEKRGSRGTAGGRRVGYLSVSELTVHNRLIMKKLRIERMYHCLARANIARLKVCRPTLKEAVNACSHQANVLKICNNIISAHRIGAFGGKPALWDFMKDVASNLNRSKKGFRFSNNSKSFTQAMKIYGGQRMCHFFSLNYCGPSYSTTKKINKTSIRFIGGEHSEIFASVAEIYKCAKIAHGIVGPVPVILAEDETKVKGRVAWEQKFDTLAGFCGIEKNHVCVSDFKPIVGSGNNGYNTIVDSFTNNRVGGFARVVMVNPLHQSLPRLVLVVNCTCNCFNAGWVRRQWKVIEKIWEDKCKDIVGPIVGHASDGDSRRRQLMLEDYKAVEGTRLKVEWHGWLFSASLDAAGNVKGLHDQDFIHNGKKLINPLDSPVRVLQLGCDIAILEHVGMVYNKFTQDEHGLKLEDTTRMDRQNWASAQRLCQGKVRQCLADLRSSPEAHRERTLGTEKYLEICANYIDIFLSPRLDLRSRLVLCSKVSFFFRLWKLWFVHGNHLVGGMACNFTIAQNFISQQCFIDIQIACNFVVLLVCHFRDKYSHLPVPLHLTGSDSCEIFFSKIGGMVGMERAYDFHELVSIANTLNRLSEIEYSENGLQFGRVHNKMENVWEHLHPLEAHESRVDLGNYTQIASNEDVVLALKEGLMEAQVMLRVLNMAPSAQCRSKVWFLTPWIIEQGDPKHMAYVKSKNAIIGEDGDSEVLREALDIASIIDVELVNSNSNNLDELEGNFEGGGVEDLTILEEETRQVVIEMVDSMELQVMSQTSSPNIVPIVTYEGHTIYKSTLVSQLNGNPFLSKDRLTRVRNSIYFNNADDYIAASSSISSMMLGLGSDCGVFFLQCNSQSSSITAAIQRTRAKPISILQIPEVGTWWIGRVQKIKRRFGTSGNRWGPCRHAIDLQNRTAQVGKKGITLPTYMIMLAWFKKIPGQLKFKYDLSDWKWIDLDSVISTVTMSFNSNTNLYSLDPADVVSLNEFVAKK